MTQPTTLPNGEQYYDRDKIKPDIANSTCTRALSHWQIEHVTNRLARRARAAATTSRHICTADALKARCGCKSGHARGSRAMHPALAMNEEVQGINDGGLDRCQTSPAIAFQVPGAPAATQIQPAGAPAAGTLFDLPPIWWTPD